MRNHFSNEFSKFLTDDDQSFFLVLYDSVLYHEITKVLFFVWSAFIFLEIFFLYVLRGYS